MTKLTLNFYKKIASYYKFFKYWNIFEINIIEIKILLK